MSKDLVPTPFYFFGFGVEGSASSSDSILPSELPVSSVVSPNSSYSSVRSFCFLRLNFCGKGARLFVFPALVLSVTTGTAGDFGTGNSTSSTSPDTSSIVSLPSRCGSGVFTSSNSFSFRGVSF